MKSVYKILGINLLLAIWSMGEGHGQQLPQFSQYMFNGLHINPGYAGYKGEPYIQSTYRSQWMDFPGAPRTLTVTADLSANEGLMGFGASILTDRFGPAQTSSGILTYAYRIQTGPESFLGLGVSAGVSEYAIDGAMFNPNDFDDVNIPEERVSLFIPNMNTGIFFHTPDFYAGISAYNLVGKKNLEREDMALAYHNLHFYLTAGVLLPVSDQVTFKPSFLIRKEQQGPSNYDVNGMFLIMERVGLGVSYRSHIKMDEAEHQNELSARNAVALVAEIFVTDNLRFGYAYDHHTNALSNTRNNSHELSVGYYIAPRNVRMKNPRWF
jgi:type IX secretion system PorP/SprF family membrane protein